jgi:16S rRNA (guanine966-N2)-methyltransferase
MREALFNMIDVSGGAFLDLFAGTGAVGCEAASRGAERVTMVENSARAVGIIKKNVAALKSAAGEGAEMEIRNMDIMKFIGRKRSNVKYRWIFCDPPYDWRQSEKLVTRIAGSGLVGPGGTLIWEASKRRLPETAFEPAKIKRYGDTVLLFYEQLDQQQRTRTK